MDDHEQDQAHHIDEQVSLPSGDLLRSVVASGPSLLRRLDRLAVHYRRAGLRFSPCLDADHLTQLVVDASPRPVVAPQPEVIVDCTPRRKVVGYSPLLL